MNVLLVNTNRVKPPIAPLGLDYLADALVQERHQVTVLDLCFHENVELAIRQTLRNFEPQVIGLTIRNTDDCYFTGGAFFLPDISKVVQLLRESCDVPIILGGVGLSVAPEAILEFVGADIAVVGSGEDSFLLFLQALADGVDPGTVPNLVIRRGNSFKRTEVRIFDNECTRYRSRALVDNVRYFREGGQAGFETKRGCDRTCIYCADQLQRESAYV